jgi:hypothetical protein
MADPMTARRTTYTSNDVEIPNDFLRGPSEKPVTLTHVPFGSSAVPEYNGSFAVVLDNVLSLAECKELIHLAEQSAQTAGGSESANQNPWRPAMVSIAPGIEAPAPGYRESDRIIWDSQTVTDLIWDRCCQVEGLKEKLAVVERTEEDKSEGRAPGRWVFSRINNRMRFLRYSPGHYFKRKLWFHASIKVVQIAPLISFTYTDKKLPAHCDGAYWYDEGTKEFQTRYTVHLYLNDSAKVSADGDLEGGATGFLSWDDQRRIDVNPKAGSVLIFQHEGLYHEGARVTKGQKFTVRTDLVYEWEDAQDYTQ